MMISDTRLPAFATMAPLSFCRMPRLLMGTTRPRCSMSSLQVDIQSVNNTRVKDARGLLQRRHRDKRNLILLEGQRLISDALQTAIQPVELFYTREALERSEKIAALRHAAIQAGASSFLVSEAVIRSLSDTVTPQGVVAVCKRPERTLPSDATLVLIADEVHDPGNLGTLLRSAAASGANAVATTTGCADVWGLKALRAGMGAQFHIPVQTTMQWDSLTCYTRDNRLHVYVAAASHDAVPYTNVDWRLPSALIIGSEANGASPAAFAAAETAVYIPMAAAVESINAAMAGTVVLFEAQRQRHVTSAG